ncbi:hypothetical protein Tco_0383020 [Tanacetum coccineum]
MIPTVKSLELQRLDLNEDKGRQDVILNLAYSAALKILIAQCSLIVNEKNFGLTECRIMQERIESGGGYYFLSEARCVGLSIMRPSKFLVLHSEWLPILFSELMIYILHYGGIGPRRARILSNLIMFLRESVLSIATFICYNAISFSGSCGESVHSDIRSSLFLLLHDSCTSVSMF